MFSFPLGGAHQEWNSSDTIDWNFINECDPSVIKQTKDIDSLQSLITLFTRASITSDDTRLFSHPLTPRLFQLMQIVIEYLLYCQKELDARSKTSDGELRKMRKKVSSLERDNRKLTASYLKQKEEITKANEVIEKLRTPCEQCPACGKKFRSGDFLDKHFAKKHAEFDSYWRAIRTAAPVRVAQDEIKELIAQLRELKQETKKRHVRAKERFEETQKMVEENEIEIEDELMSTHNDLRADLQAAADELSSSMELYRKTRPNKKQIVGIFNTARVNVSNPFVSKKQQVQTQRDFVLDPEKPRTPDFQKPEIIVNPEEDVEELQVSVKKEKAETKQKRSHAKTKKSHKNEAVVSLAKKFLSPGYRQERFQMNEDQMEEMITSVSKRIQAEIAGVKTEPPPAPVVHKTPEPVEEESEKPKMNVSSIAEYSDPEIEKECPSNSVQASPDVSENPAPESSRRRKKRRHHSVKEEPAFKIPEEPSKKSLASPQKVIQRQPIKIPEEPTQQQPTVIPTITFASQAKKQPRKIDPEPVPVPQKEDEPEEDPFALPSESTDQFLMQSSHAAEPSVDQFVMSSTHEPSRHETNFPHVRGLDINESELEALMREEEYSDAIDDTPDHDLPKARGLEINNSELDMLLNLTENSEPSIDKQNPMNIAELPKPKKRVISETNSDYESDAKYNQSYLQGSQTFVEDGTYHSDGSLGYAYDYDMDEEVYVEQPKRLLNLGVSGGKPRLLQLGGRPIDL